MQAIQSLLSQKSGEALEKLFSLSGEKPELQPTRKEFEGDLTLVVFPYLKASRKKPEDTATAIGEYLKNELAEVADFNVVKGFLNLVVADSFWIEQLESILEPEKYGFQPEGEETLLVEYSSPNTNKPLHLGHIRNILLGYSMAEILKAAGKKTQKVQIINDRGIHICKSMLAWQKFGNGETPESSDMKGDHLVGKYYVEFDKWNKEENLKLQRDIKEIIEKEPNPEEDHHYLFYETAAGFFFQGFFAEQTVLQSKTPQNEEDKKADSPRWFNEVKNAFEEVESHLINDDSKNAELSLQTISEIKFLIEKRLPQLPAFEAQKMLSDWEAGDPETVKLWETMNGWVYSGFDRTYRNLGVDFDKNYYESQTYLLGKEVVEEGLKKEVFFQKDDGSVWCDLEDEKLGEKLLLRKDGTSVYMTQDIGTAIQRYRDFGMDGMIYTVGNEQDHHFKVLFAILKKLGYKWAEKLYHLSYGMVDLPTGKMKSREGTVVDADDLIEEMQSTAKDISEELGKTEGMTAGEKQTLYHMVGLGALKYYILRVDPRKRMLFNPEESVDFQGDTGPFIQYTHARIKSLLRKAQEIDFSGTPTALHPQERELVKKLLQYPEKVKEAAGQFSPATIAGYVYDLVKTYNALYQQVPILSDENKAAIAFRVKLSERVAAVVKNGMKLLGIEVPERM